MRKSQLAFIILGAHASAAISAQKDINCPSDNNAPRDLSVSWSLKKTTPDSAAPSPKQITFGKTDRTVKICLDSTFIKNNPQAPADVTVSYWENRDQRVEESGVIHAGEEFDVTGGNITVLLKHGNGATANFRYYLVPIGAPVANKSSVQHRAHKAIRQ